jgi:hypothetical protein
LPVRFHITVSFCCTLAFGGKTIVIGDESAEQAYVFERPYIILDLTAKIPGKIIKSGSTIPIKFLLAEADGTPIGDAEARRLASDCSVRIFFTGGDPSPNCAVWNGERFEFSLKTSKDLAPGTYTVTVKVFVDGVEATTQSVDVVIR